MMDYSRYNDHDEYNRYIVDKYNLNQVLYKKYRPHMRPILIVKYAGC